MTTAEKDDKKIVFIQNDDNTFVDYFRELHSRYRLDFRKANRSYKTNIASRVVLAVGKEDGTFWLQVEKGRLIELVSTNNDELKTILSEIIHGFYVLEAIRKGGPIPKRKETGRVTSLSKSIKKPEQVASSTARKPSAPPPPPPPPPDPPREEKKQPASPTSPPEATGGRSSRRKRRPPKRTMPGESSSGESSNNTASRATNKKQKRTKIPTPSEDLPHESSDATEQEHSVASRRPYHWQPPPPKDDMMEALAYFKKLFGHTSIPPNWAGHPELAAWAALQRQVHRETCQGYRPATAEEKDQLQQLDPIRELDWNVKDGYEKEQDPQTVESVIIV